jgi:hypothetical protein
MEPPVTPKLDGSEKVPEVNVTWSGVLPPPPDIEPERLVALKTPPATVNEAPWNVAAMLPEQGSLPADVGTVSLPKLTVTGPSDIGGGVWDCSFWISSWQIPLTAGRPGVPVPGGEVVEDEDAPGAKVVEVAEVEEVADVDVVVEEEEEERLTGPGSPTESGMVRVD